jgi:alkylresorcinol/alkylpyrone synthase
MYLDNDPGVLISACLFGDGAGAAVLSAEPNERGRRVAWQDGASLIEPRQREALMFEQKDGMLRNILTREVPAQDSSAVNEMKSRGLKVIAVKPAELAAWRKVAKIGPAVPFKAAK